MDIPQKKSSKLSKLKLDVIRRDMSDAHHDFEAGLEKRALYKTNNVELGHDLVQDTFLKTLLYLQKGGNIIVMKSFLNHVLSDLVIDEYRKNKTISLDTLFEKGLDLSFEDQKVIENIFDGKQIVLLIPLLSKKYRGVMHMRYIQDLSLKEMSLITGQSQNTVAVQAHRGLEKLKILYDESHSITNVLTESKTN